MYEILQLSQIMFLFLCLMFSTFSMSLVNLHYKCSYCAMKYMFNTRLNFKWMHVEFHKGLPSYKIFILNKCVY